MADKDKVVGIPEPTQPPGETEPEKPAKTISALDILKGIPIPKGPLAGVYNAVGKLPRKDQI